MNCNTRGPARDLSLSKFHAAMPFNMRTNGNALSFRTSVKRRDVVIEPIEIDTRLKNPLHVSTLWRFASVDSHYCSLSQILSDKGPPPHRHRCGGGMQARTAVPRSNQGAVPAVRRPEELSRKARHHR